MPEWNGLDLDVLEPAIEAARKALRRLDEEDIPAPLQKVAASSARSLPPPMAQRLLEALDGDGWLRSKAIAELADSDDSLARAFLEGREGWELEAARIRLEAAVDRLTQERDQALARATAIEERHDRIQARERGLVASLEQVRRSVGEARKDERERVKARLDKLRSELLGAQAEITTLGDRIRKLESELEEGRGRIAALETRLRNRSGPPVDEPGVITRGKGAPVESARMLDQTAASLVQAVHLALPGMNEPSGFELPPGVRPDDPSAVSAVASWSGPVTLIVDGYNLAKTIDEKAALPDARLRVEEILRRLRRLAAGQLRVILVWDSSEGDDDRSDGGIEIRFRPSADDEIAALSASITGSVVVVSADREVRFRVEEAGATGLWSSALAGWRP